MNQEFNSTFKIRSCRDRLIGALKVAFTLASLDVCHYLCHYNSLMELYVEKLGGDWITSKNIIIQALAIIHVKTYI